MYIYIYYNTYIMMYIYILYYSKSLAKPPPKTYPRLRSHLGCSKPCHLLHSSTRSDLSPRHDLNLTRWWFPDLTHTLLPWENDNNSNPGASEASFPKKIWSIGVTYKNYKKHQLDKSNQIKSVYYVWICLKIDSVPLNPMANHHYLISIYINGHLEDVYPRWFEITNLRPERYAGVSFPRPWKNLPSTRSQ